MSDEELICMSDEELIALLKDALANPDRQRALLSQPEILREMMNRIPVRRWLFEQACQTDACAKAKARQLIVRIIQSSEQLWCGGTPSPPPQVYEEALARTQAWFWEKFESYDPELASFLTWLNERLRWRIRDEQSKPLPPDDSAILDTIRASDPDKWRETIEDWLRLIENDTVLYSRRMRSSPHVNGRDLLTKILQELLNSGEFSWEAIAQTYQVNPSTLRHFCRSQCLPHFRQLLSEWLSTL